MSDAPPPLPAGFRTLRRLDPGLAEELEGDFLRLLRAGEALAWAQQRLPELLAAETPAARLRLIVEASRSLTEAPEVWAVRWTGELEDGSMSVVAVAGDARRALSPDGISQTIVAQVIRDQRPSWSDDARIDARYTGARSVQAFSLRSVGCLPLGARGVLYLHDPRGPGRFPLGRRARLAALCALAAPLFEVQSAPPRRRAAIPGLIGGSPAMLAAAESIEAFAPLPWPALILGETGTGKEVAARAIHRLSARSGGPFVAVNAGAIPEELAEAELFGHEKGAFTGAHAAREGLVDRAAGGTLFLDEIGELSPRIQVKLLRLLQEGTYTPVGGRRERRLDARVLAATHRQLGEGEGGFRQDLYYRLAACVIHLPPLRERHGDVGPLAEHLLQRALSELPGAPSIALSDAALAALEAQPWPGNVRELENCIRGAIGRAIGGRSELILPEHVGAAPAGGAGGGPAPVAAGLDLKAATEAFQRGRVRAALEASGGNRTRAAEALGVSRQWLHRLLERWGGAP